MSKGTAIKDAIKQFETAKGVVAADAEKARAGRRRRLNTLSRIFTRGGGRLGSPL
jgi:hypothetical protein